MPQRFSRTQHEPHHHAVQFYGHESSLFTSVAGFLGEGLANGEPAIVIATPKHREAILDYLDDRRIDCAHARHQGDLVMLDAEETLSLFMLGSEPNAAAFEHNIGGLVEQTIDGRQDTVVRAYGEMVDVLWKQGRPDAAISLEILWNKLGARYGFSLLCGYAIGNFYKQSKRFQDVCEQHDDVLRSDDNLLPFGRKRRTRSARPVSTT